MFVIDVFNEFHKLNKNAMLLLIGDGELRKEVESKVMNLGLNNYVIFTGIRSDVSEIFQALDILLFPSLYEGLPVTLVEAQTSGLKVVASDTITEEVAITDLVEFLPLNLSPKKWAENLNSFQPSNIREKYFSLIRESLFNIDKTTAELQKLYLTLSVSK